MVSDGNSSTSTSFVVTVLAVNDAPQISNLGDRTFSETQSPESILFTLSDIDSPIGSLTTLVHSSNSQLIDSNNLILTGSAMIALCHGQPNHRFMARR